MAGALLLNGNAETEADLLEAARPLLLSSRHGDDEVRASRRVLLVTAGWAENEHDEGHVKRALNAMGIASSFDGGFDRSLVNLSLLGEQKKLFAEAPALAEAWREQARVKETARSFYLEHNAHTIALFRRTLRAAKDVDPTLDAQSLLAEDKRSSANRPLLRYALGRELRQALETLEANDNHLVDLLREIEERTFDAAGIAYSAGWRAARERLEQRVLSANTIVFFGGRLDLFLDGLRFFRLRDALSEALRRGTQLVAMSAGAMVLCERVIIYDDLADTPRDFQLFDRGLAVVRDLQLFPHCMERIQTDDPDNLGYLARRFRHHVCVGLNQKSFLLLEVDPKRATSLGAGDSVYVFDPSGKKASYRKGEEIPL